MFLNSYSRVSCKQYADAGKMHKAQISACMFIVAGGNAAKLLQFEEKALHEMTFLVSPPVAEPRLKFVRLRRDAVISLMGSNVFPKPECTVSFVSEHHRTLDGDRAQQFLCNNDIVHVSRRKLNMNGIPQRVNGRVNLRAAPAAAHSDAFVLALVLGIAFPFFAAPALAL